MGTLQGLTSHFLSVGGDIGFHQAPEQKQALYKKSLIVISTGINRCLLKVNYFAQIVRKIDLPLNEYSNGQDESSAT